MFVSLCASFFSFFFFFFFFFWRVGGCKMWDLIVITPDHYLPFYFEFKGIYERKTC